MKDEQAEHQHFYSAAFRNEAKSFFQTYDALPSTFKIAQSMKGNQKAEEVDEDIKTTSKRPTRTQKTKETWKMTKK